MEGEKQKMRDRDEIDGSTEEKKEEGSDGVSGEGGPNKSAAAGMKTHRRSTFPEVSAIR